jgi:Icc-related predicted phosphoesterase
MIIDCIADLHGHYPKLEGGDLLIVAGDLTARDDYEGYCKFNEWMIGNSRKYKKCIIIAGNHDNGLLPGRFNVESLPRIEYLCDSGTEFEGYRIWGTPWTKTFEGMNPKCKAFTCDTEEELAEKWALIPDNTDILITHGPPYGILDQAKKFNYPQTNTRMDCFLNGQFEHVGSKSLDKKIGKMKDFPGVHVFGHIHEAYGQEEVTYNGKLHKIINCSHVNEYYEPVNKPIRVIL